MTKRFEQQGKTVSVTMIREGFVEQIKCRRTAAAAEKSLVTGYVKFCYVPMVNRGLPVVPSLPVSTLSGPELALQKLGKTPLGRYLSHHRH